MTCSGNPGEYCGAGSKLSLYKKKSVISPPSSETPDPTPSITTPVETPPATPTPTSPIYNPGNADYGLEGCYTEATTGRALQFLTGANNMDINKCLAICSAYNYSGVEYGFVPLLHWNRPVYDFR